MQFTSLDLQNFMSFESQSFEDLDHSGLTLIEGQNLDEGGSNGSGKSSLWDGISFALFGKTARGMKGDEVINRKFKKDCGVTLGLWFNGNKYFISRYRKHDDFGDRLLVQHNKGSKKETVELGTIDMTQKWIEQEFRIDYDLFKCTIMFAQGETFNFVDAGNKMQKEILAKIMKINYDAWLSKAKKKLSDLRESVADYEKDISILESHIKEEHELGYKQESEEWEANHKENLDRVRRLVGKEPKKPDLSKMAELKALKAKFKTKLDEAEESFDAIKSEWHKLRAEIALLDKTIIGLKDPSKKGECPSCYQNIDEKIIKNLLAEKRKERDGLDSKSKELSSQLEALKAKVDDLESKKETIGEKIESLESKSEEYQELYDNWRDAKKELDAYEAEVNPFIKLREDEEKQQKEIRKKIKDLQKQCETLRDQVPYYNFWVNAFGDSGIKSFVFDLICSNLTNKANKFLNLMSKGSVSISFDTQKKLKSGEIREKFDCEIVKGGERVEYATYSGGEKRRISLAVDMALAEIMGDYHGSNFSMIVFDEQTNYLDAGGRESFMNLLKDLAERKAVFVVDHDDLFKSRFDHVWTIQKKNGVSKLL